MKRSAFLLAFGLLILSGPGVAQYPLGAASLWWSGSSGGTAGSFCWDSDWSCMPDSVSATAGEMVTMNIRGELNAPYVVGLASGIGPCQPVPGVINALLLDATAVPALSGFLSQPSPILACPPGVETLVFPFPPLPPGTNLAIQGLTFGAGNAAVFTKAIVINVI